MQDATKPTFIIQNDNQIKIQIPLSDSVPALFLSNQPIPHINTITDIILPKPIIPQTNFGIGWWMYVNNK